MSGGINRLRLPFGETHPARTKIIEGLLELLPVGRWTEEELRQWVVLVESGLRVYYRLPQSPEPMSPVTASQDEP